MRRLLAHPLVYSAFRRIVGRDSARAWYAREHLRVQTGQRVLDLGCGTGDILEVLPEVDYVGYDVSPQYIERARRRFARRGEFHCRAVDEALPVAPASFDVVIAHGVLHHLDDEAARALLSVARRALAPGGRLVTYDGCFAAGQSMLARFVVSLDRGRHVRSREAYEHLARAEFDDVKTFVRHDLVRIPYTHLIMECGKLPAAVYPVVGKVSREERWRRLGQRPITVWLTGLSGAGKSTLGAELERRLIDAGRPCYLLDGDNVRAGINRDLGFGPRDRHENIRRVAEIARLMNDAGVIALTAFISPYRADRRMAREVVGADRFVEVYLNAPLEVCERRDPKGLYRKARGGELAEFTGVTAPYEAPEAAELVLATGSRGIEDCVAELLAVVSARVRQP